MTMLLCICQNRWSAVLRDLLSEMLVVHHGCRQQPQVDATIGIHPMIGNAVSLNACQNLPHM